MKKRMRLVLLAAVAGLGLAGLVGCSGSGPQMKVGIVNTARIVQENPKYLDLNVLLMQERNAVYSQIPSNVRELSDSAKRKLQEKLAKEAAERSGQFDKLVRDFMQKLQGDIQDSAGEVARDKGIDMVIIDTPYYPTVLYSSGENITTDILLKMRSK